MTAYLIDTNVLMAASAAYDQLCRRRDHAMPLEPDLREQVLDWLTRFEKSPDRWVLDEQQEIRQEYEDNLGFNPAMHAQEYGLQVLQSKWDRGQVEYVELEPLTHDILACVGDRADQKWVAAGIAFSILYDSVSPIVYAAETDWYLIERDPAKLNPLNAVGIAFLRLLPDAWYDEHAK
jgi:hypothetical protein